MAPSGLVGLMFGLLFPVNLVLILLTGGQLFTGNSAAMPAAVYEGKATVMDLIKNWCLVWIGNQSGALLFAALVYASGGLDNDGTKFFAAATVVKKCSSLWGQTFIKAIMCNWLVCMAVWLQGQAQDMSGKVLGIYIPISAFVAMGFEHCVANMFILPFGLMAGAEWSDGEALNVGDILWYNLIPATLGNAFAGAFIVAGGYSFAFGRLGNETLPSEAAKEPEPEPVPQVAPPDMKDGYAVEISSKPGSNI